MIHVEKDGKRLITKIEGDATTICADMSVVMEAFSKVYADSEGIKPETALTLLSAAITKAVINKWEKHGYEG